MTASTIRKIQAQGENTMPKHDPIIGRSGGSVKILKAGTAKTAPRFDALIYTGGPLIIGGWELPVIVDLAGVKPGKVLVANLDHDSTKRVSSGFTVINNGRTLRARGEFNALTKSRNEVLKSARAGYQWQASIEANPQKVQQIRGGENVNVNGQQHEGPLYVTRTSTLKGFAFVSHGADDNTTVALAAKSSQLSMAKMLAGSSMQHKVAALGAITLATLEQLSGVDGLEVLDILTAAAVEPEFEHEGVNHFPVLESLTAIIHATNNISGTIRAA
jgi:hypothetical protein